MRYVSRAIRLFAVVAVTAGIASCTGPQVRHVVLQCDDGTPLSATYAPDRSSVTVENGGTVTLQVARSASGARYAGPEAEFWEHRGAFRWIRPGKPAVTCVVSTEPGSGAPIGIANPASVHCAEVGGRNVTETLPNGSEFGVCLFEDNRQCGQWALFRGGVSRRRASDHRISIGRRALLRDYRFHLRRLGRERNLHDAGRQGLRPSDLFRRDLSLRTDGYLAPRMRGRPSSFHSLREPKFGCPRQP